MVVFGFVVNFISMTLFMFSIVLPKTILFIGLKKLLSSSVFASFLLYVLKSRYDFYQGLCLNYIILQVFFTITVNSTKYSRFFL